jgi:hypothetical protein
MPEVLREPLARLTGAAIVLFAWLMTAVRGVWQGVAPRRGAQRIYFANHTSNGDFVLVWAALPPHLRRRDAARGGVGLLADDAAAPFIGRDVFRAVLIDRRPEARTEDPMAAILAALDDRRVADPVPRRQAQHDRRAPAAVQVGALQPVGGAARGGPGAAWIANLNHVMPKGKVIPVPLMCTVTFGAPIRAEPDEDRHAFLDRAQAALWPWPPKGPAP